MTRSLVVIGSGPGIGVHVASHFASKGFSKIALLARSTGQLERDSAAVRSDHGHVDVRAYPVDVTDSAGLRAALGKITDDLGPPEVVFFNAARVKPSLLLEVGDEEMLYDFKISAVALHQTAKWAIPHLTKLAKQDSSAKPSLLVTSSHLPQSPEPDVFVLSLTKAAQRNLAESLAKVYQPQGVHVGLVIVAGSVAPEKTVLSPRNIAKKTYELFAQEKGDGPWRRAWRSRSSPADSQHAYTQYTACIERICPDGCFARVQAMRPAVKQPTASVHTRYT